MSDKTEFSVEEICDAVNKFPGGCNEGKRNFLRDLGCLSDAIVTKSFIVTFERPDNGYGDITISSADLEDKIRHNAGLGIFNEERRGTVRVTEA